MKNQKKYKEIREVRNDKCKNFATEEYDELHMLTATDQLRRKLLI